MAGKVESMKSQLAAEFSVFGVEVRSVLNYRVSSIEHLSIEMSMGWLRLVGSIKS